MSDTKKFFFVIWVCILCIALIIVTFQASLAIAKFIRQKQFEKEYSDWQVVTVDRLGTFYVPEDWIFTQEDNIVYITDKPITETDCKIYLIGALFEWWKEHEKTESVNIADLFENAEYIERIMGSGQMFSNGAYYGQEVYKVDDNIIYKYYINFHNEKGHLGFSNIHFLAWDDLLDEDMVIRIARSYRMERVE